MSVVSGAKLRASPGTARELLGRILGRVRRSFEASSEVAADFVREGIGEELNGLQACLERVLAGEQPSEACSILGRPALHIRLVHVLRVEVLHAAPDEDPAAVIGLLQALEAVLGGLSGDGPEDLRARLAQPDAFELLFEVAHDLRSPLTSILFLSETLRGGHSGDVNPVQRSQLGLIYSAALGLVSMATDVVDLAGQRAGAVSEEPEVFALSEVFRGLEDMVLPMAEEKGIELRLRIPEYERSFGHPIALGRVLLNLTTNALKFTDEGYVEVGVKRKPRFRQEFYVRDTGRGIPPERQGDLFRAFKRRGSGDGHFFSSGGVGLSIARRLVRAMGSELELETAQGWGTRFHFTLDATPPR